MGTPLTGAERQARWRRRHPEKNLALARVRAHKNNPRRVFGGSGYLGMAPRPEQASELNQMARDFRAQQKGAA